MLTPLFLMILNSFQTARPGQPIVWGIEGWIKAFTTPGIVKAMTNTMTLALTRQAIALLIGAFFAWLIARTDIPMKGTLEFFFWLSFFLPALPETMGWILLLDPKYGLMNQGIHKLRHHQPAVVQHLFVLGHRLGPYGRHGERQSHAAGAGVSQSRCGPGRGVENLRGERPRTFFHIVIPVMMPAILVTTILGLIRSLEAFEIELLLGTPIGLQVYSTKIHELVTWEPPQFAPAMALSTIFLGGLLLMVAIQRKYIGQRSYETMTGRGFSIGRRRLAVAISGIWSWCCCLPLFVTLGADDLLVMGTFMKLFGFFHIADPWTLDNWRTTLSDPVLAALDLEYYGDRAGFRVGGRVVLLFDRLCRRQDPICGRGLLDFLSWLPWSVPGIFLGVALLWTFLQTKIFLPIYGTIYILMIAMVIKSMPFGAQMIKSVLIQLGSDLEEASKVCGATWLHTFQPGDLSVDHAGDDYGRVWSGLSPRRAISARWSCSVRVSRARCRCSCSISRLAPSSKKPRWSPSSSSRWSSALRCAPALSAARWGWKELKMLFNMCSFIPITTAFSFLPLPHLSPHSPLLVYPGFLPHSVPLISLLRNPGLSGDDSASPESGSTKQTLSFCACWIIRHRIWLPGDNRA